MDTFEKGKAIVKKFKKKKKLTNEDRLFKMRDLLGRKQVDLATYTELIQLTTNRGAALSEGYVANQLRDPENRVVIYDRNTKLLPDSEHGASGFMIYKMKLEGQKVVAEVLILLSMDGSTKIQNILKEDSLDLKLKSKNPIAKSCGEVSLNDLEEFIKTLLIYMEIEEAEINLESVNVEYVVSFYIKNGFVPSNKDPHDEDCIAMTKRISLDRTLESIMQPQNIRRLIYKGMNRNGNKYFSYSDGSYSYMNTDSLGRLTSAYHSYSDGHRELGFVPEKRRKLFDTESDEEELSLPDNSD